MQASHNPMNRFIKIPIWIQPFAPTFGTMDFSRQTQAEQQENIFVQESESETEEETWSQPNKRPNDNFRDCDASEGGPPTSIETIRFVYDVETNVEELPMEVEEKILETLTTSMVNSIFETHCGRRLGNSNRKLQIQSIAPGANDRFLETCNSQNVHSKSCKRYDGSLVVGFNDEGKEFSRESVGSAVLQRIAVDMNNDEYLSSLNLAVQSSGVGVTNVNYEGSGFYDQFQNNFAAVNSQSYSVEKGLSSLGKAAVPILLAMSFCMVGAICLMQRAISRRQKKMHATLVSEEEEFDHSRDEKSYLSADLNDLGRCHTKMDVMRCNKSNCSACNVLPSILEVDTPSTDDRPSHQPYVETRLDSGSSNVDQSLDSIFCMKTDMRRKRKMFSFGRPRPSPTIEVIGEENLNQMESFEDEPKSVNFVKIEDREVEEELIVMGKKRSFVDNSGYVRNEIEL